MQGLNHFARSDERTLLNYSFTFEWLKPTKHFTFFPKQIPAQPQLPATKGCVGSILRKKNALTNKSNASGINGVS